MASRRRLSAAWAWARLAARVDPAHAAVAQRHGEGGLEHPVGHGVVQGLDHQLAIARVDPFDHGLGGQDGSCLDLQQGGHIVGQGCFALGQIPFPHAAARGFDGHPEAPFGVGPASAGSHLAPVLHRDHRQH